MKKATIINLNRSIYYMNTDVIGKKDGFVIRLAKADDAVNYYEQNYCPLDKEVARLTGCKEEFSRDEVISFFSEIT